MAVYPKLLRTRSLRIDGPSPVAKKGTRPHDWWMRLIKGTRAHPPLQPYAMSRIHTPGIGSRARCIPRCACRSEANWWGLDMTAGHVFFLSFVVVRFFVCVFCVYAAAIYHAARPRRTHGSPSLAHTRKHFMGELTTQVGISDISNCKTWYENERVCGMSLPGECVRTKSGQAVRDVPTLRTSQLAGSSGRARGRRPARR